MYDESYRTPLLVDWPGVTQTGRVNNDLVSNLDLHRPFSIWPVHLPKTCKGSLVSLLKVKQKLAKISLLSLQGISGYMVHRHEGVYDGRYKLMNFADLDDGNFMTCSPT